MDEKQKKEKKEKKPKKQKPVSVKLPSARRSIIRQRHMAQGKANWEGLLSLIGSAIVLLIIVFILAGGINQRKFIETIGDLSGNLGNKIGSCYNPDAVDVNDDGIYYRFNCSGKVPEN